MTKLVPVIAAAIVPVLLCGCIQTPAVASEGSAVASRSILARSIPTNGATVAGRVNELELWFNPPARLGEVTVTGPNGMMPMMVTAVGEVGYYSLPLSGLGPGKYAVNWKAMAKGRDYQGGFSFTVSD